MKLNFSRRFIKPLWFSKDVILIDPLASGSVKLAISGSSRDLSTFDQRGYFIGQRNRDTGEIAIDLQVSFLIDQRTKGLARIALSPGAAKQIKKSADPDFEYELILDDVEFIDVTNETDAAT